MLTRIISSIVCLPIFIGFIMWGGLPLKLGVLVLSLIGMHEFYQAFSLKNKSLSIIGYLFAIFYVLFLEWLHGQAYYFSVFLTIFLMILFIYAVVYHQHTDVMQCVITFFGFFYVCFLMSHIYLIRTYPNGQLFIWLAFLCAWGCDTGAYFTGVTLGKHKLIPALSPKKTIEGSVGGIVVALVLSLIYGYVIHKYFVPEDSMVLLLCGITGLVGSMLSQIGDLAASAMKRYSGVKDFGTVIPGHGGILDRFDSVLLTAPLVYGVMVCLFQ